MATKARIVYGTTSEWGTDGSTYASIPEVKALAVPEETIEYLDVTNFDSTGGFREFIPGLRDNGELTLQANYTSALYDTAKGYADNKTLIYFQTTLPLETDQTVGDVFQFTGYVTPRLQTNDVGEPIMLDLVIRTSGSVTFTQGA